ncbi:MAG: peptidylprolyl cis-trans isomerase lipoprotein, PpiC-type [Deltaproteobacteria bacterium]|nr:peptidylprolyl cis-trans isomerase lipoprotein, PpiC-type [Deltaproteobacteria bacterium]MBS1243678.1 peptidylprolyl cis-trans isomerase lipoprotein, PpiC-type [Deltaproteobacteria bacterium]
MSPARARAGFALAAAFAAVLWACSPAPSQRSDAEIDVAEVDGAPILLRDVKNEILSMRGYTPSLEARGPGREEVSEAVRLLIERTVVLREGERRGVTLPARALEEEVMRFRADFPPGGLEKALLKAGVEPDTWREQLRRSLLYRRSADAIAASGASVTPQEVEAAFRRERHPADVPERIRVRQYLFDSVQRAAVAREKLQAGEHAGGDGGDRSSEGVDLGFFGREELPPELPAELFGLPEGGVSEPVSGDGVVSLFQVTRREAARAQTLRSEEARIRESILAPRREEAFRRWLAQATAGAKVKVHAELLQKLVEEKR